MPAALTPVLSTDQIDAGRVIFNANDAKLNAALTLVEARTTTLERLSFAAGTYVGSQPITFSYSPNAGAPVLATPRQSAAITVTTGPGSDFDGKVAISFLNASRAVVTTTNAETNQNNGNQFRGTVVDLSMGGAATAVSTVAWGINLTNNGNARPAILGSVTVAATTVRAMGYVVNGSPNQWLAPLVSYSVDATSGAITVGIDTVADGWSGTTSGGGIPLGMTYRKKGYLVGSFGALFLRGLNTFFATTLTKVAAAFVTDRSAGSSWTGLKFLSGLLGTGSFAAEPITSSLLLVLSDGSGAGATSAGTQIALVNTEDLAGGPMSVLRLGNALAGNTRVTVLSATLAIFGFTAGSQYYTGVVMRDPATNVLTLVGGLAMNGNLGVPPLEIIRVGATRFALVFKGAATAVLLSYYDVNVAAGSGANPCTLVATLQFAFLADVTGGTAADNSDVYGVEHVPGNVDRLLLVGRNTTRSITAAQAVDVTY